MVAVNDYDLSLPDEIQVEEFKGAHDVAIQARRLSEGERQFEELDEVKQGLHQRHIQMIALAGTIGTGLFLSSGQALSQGGPAGAFMGYSIVGAAVAGVVLAVGEMGALVPLSGGIVRYAEYFVDPALSFADGWNQVYNFAVGIPAEVVAAAVLIEFWVTINNAIWITVLSFPMVVVSLFFVRIYGELEFGFAILKIMLIIGVNILAIVVTCGGGPQGQPIGFRYWRNPGPFVQFLDIPGPLGRFMGFYTVLSNAVYAYAGIENITLAAAETRNPRRAIPMAAKRVFWRILLFYIISIFTITLVIPSDDPNLLSGSGAASSPFVIAARNAGIKIVPSIINAIIITSAWSSGNSNTLGGSRILYGLAMHDHAPKFFLRINRFGIPYIAVLFFSLFIGLGYMTLSSTAATVFAWFQNCVAISALVNWVIILVTYLRFYYGCKKQGIDRKKSLPWAAPVQPYISWAALCLLVLLLFTGGYTTFIHGQWNTQTFVSSYLNIPLVLILYFGYKFYKKTRIVPLDQIPIKTFIAVYQAHPEPPRRKKTGLARANILWG